MPNCVRQTRLRVFQFGCLPAATSRVRLRLSLRTGRALRTQIGIGHGGAFRPWCCRWRQRVLRRGICQMSCRRPRFPTAGESDLPTIR
jgi:hypothetical protein